MVIHSHWLAITGTANQEAVLTIGIANQQVCLIPEKILLDPINEILSRLVGHTVSQMDRTNGNRLLAHIHVMPLLVGPIKETPQGVDHTHEIIQLVRLSHETLLLVAPIHGIRRQVVHIHETRQPVDLTSVKHPVIVLSVVTRIRAVLRTAETLSLRHHLSRMFSQTLVTETLRPALGHSERVSRRDPPTSGIQVWEVVPPRLVIVLNLTVQGPPRCSRPQVYKLRHCQGVN